MKNIVTKLKDIETNNVFSPLSLYYAIALLSRVTSGNTKKEILDVLKLEDGQVIEKINYLNEMFNRNISSSKTMLNSSLWLNDHFKFNDDEIKKIVKGVPCAIRTGTMGTKALDKEIHRWINTNTHNILKDSVKNIKTDVNDIFNIISTIYLKDKWSNFFDESNNKKDTFYISKDEKIKCTFMNSKINEEILVGNNFKAMKLDLCRFGKVIFIRPDDGYNLKDIENNDDLIELLCGNNKHLKKEFYNVDLSLPKFVIESNSDIKDNMKLLGINDVFDKDVADFSKVTNEKEVFMSKAILNTKFEVNETGIEAAAFSYLDCAFGSICLDELKQIKFKLNKPFMFSVISNELPVFVGTITNPNDIH